MSVKLFNCIYNIKCKECSKESLDLELCISCNNGYYQKIDDIPSENSFIKCYKDPEGYYLDDNIYKPCYSSCKQCSGYGDNINHNCTECNSNFKIKMNQNCYENCPFYYYFDSFNRTQCTEEYKCPKEKNKLIIEKNKCIEDCIKDDIYKLEFNNTCYKSCPKGTKINNNNLCNIECPEDKPYENENNECVQKCNADDFFVGNCKINNNNQQTIDDMIKNIKEQLNSTLDELIKNITDGDKKDLLIKAKEATYQLTTTENQNNNEYNNISTIKLGECENILKDEYHIDRNKSLLIFKIDYYMPGISIPVIGYEVYHPDTKEKLNLNLCKDSLIDFDIPVSIDENSLFKYDPNNEYYVDECYTYTTENGTDIVLNDRKEEFVDNNLSLCENKCEYKGYEEGTKKASCKCEVKSKEFVISNIIEDENLLSNNFTYDNFSSTITSMKCIYTIFSKEGLVRNYANYILIFIFIAYIILIILFYKVGFYILEEEIKKIIKFKDSNENNININTSISGKKVIKRKHKKKKRKSKNISNPIKRRKISINTSGKVSFKDSFKSSQYDLKNTNILMDSEKVHDNKINIFKKNENFNGKGKINISFKELYDCELNSFSYEEALEFDKRTYFQYYISLLKAKHPILFSFVPMNDYNTIIIKLSLFLLSFTIYFSINTLFFTKSTIHQIYKDQGIYYIKHQILKIILSFIISHTICFIIKYFSLSERNIIKLKYYIFLDKGKEVDKVAELKKCLIIKYVCYFLSSVIFIIFFWYYLSSFCAVYKNSQIYLIINTIICVCISFLYPFIINLMPGIFRLIALNSKNKLLFIISKIIQTL